MSSPSQLTAHSQTQTMSRRRMLIGVGDSSFLQLPCPAAPLSREHNGGVVEGLEILQISCGTTAAAALVSNGEDELPCLLEWGTDLYGERPSPTAPQTWASGTATEEPAVPSTHPTPVSLHPPRSLGNQRVVIQHIAFGAHFLIAAIDTGGCMSWGGGRDLRALGRGGCGSCRSSLCSGSASDIPQRNSGKPDWVAEPLGVRGLRVVNLAAGDDHVVAVCADGSARAWGRGNCGQLGAGVPGVDGADGACVPTRVELQDATDATSRKGRGSAPRSTAFRAAACGRDHSALLTDDGRLLAFGSGLYGQLGLGTVGERTWTPTAVDSLEGVGTMRADGSFTGVASVACGAWHTAAVSTTGDVYAWGWARFGALGPMPRDGPPPRSTHVEEEEESDTGSHNNRKSVSSTGDGAEVKPYPGLVDGLDDLLSSDDRIVSVSCGARYTVALSLEKRAFVWGEITPSADSGGGGGGRSGTVKSNSPLSSLVFPRELRPAELIGEASAGAAATAVKLPGGKQAARCCSCSGGEGGEADGAGGGGRDESRWRVSAVGCGPWYIVLGLEEKGRAERKLL